MAARRGNHEGNITKRGDSFRALVQVNGTRHSVTGKTKADVQKRVRDLLHDAERGVAPATEKLTIAEYMHRWLDGVRPNLRETTHTSYGMLNRLYIVPAFGAVKLATLRPDHIRAMYAAMRERGLSEHTQQRAHACLRTALNQAVEDGLLPSNVASRKASRPPRVPGAEMKTLTPEQVRTLLETAEGTRWGALLALAITSGLREGELLALRWSDLDPGAGTVRVTRQLGTDLVFREPKSAAGRRTVHVPASTVERLEEHRRAQREERVRAYAWADGDLVFCTQEGKPLQASNVVRAFKALLEKARLPRMRFHDLRHTSATLLLLGGVSPRVVQERLGHADIRLTLGTYSHVLPGMGRDAADRLDTLLG